MSVESVKAFFEKAAEDEALLNEMRVLAKREIALYGELVQIASAAGFKFNIEDARRARLESARELDDEELGAIVSEPCEIQLLCGGGSA